MGSDRSAEYSRAYLERNKAFMEWRDWADARIEDLINQGHSFEEAQFLGTLFARREKPDLFEKLMRLDEDLHLADRGIWQENADAQRAAMEGVAAVTAAATEEEG